MSQRIAMSERIAVPREIAGIRIPDSALAQKAMDLAFRVSPTVVWTHVVRTFVFGALVGRAQKLRYDEELNSRQASNRWMYRPFARVVRLKTGSSRPCRR